MKQIRKRLTYANVMSSIAIFLILGGATAVAARKIGSNQLKANSVTTAKLKRNAVSANKLRKNAVTTPKIRGGSVTSPKLAANSVDFTKITPGTNLLGTATGTIGATQGTTKGPPPLEEIEPANIPLSGLITFTPTAGVLNQLNVEVRGNLTQVGTEECEVQVRPYVNGNPWLVSNGFLNVSTAGTPPFPSEPNGRPLVGETGPVGLTTPGVPVTIGARFFGDVDCTAGSTVSVAIAVTQIK